MLQACDIMWQVCMKHMGGALQVVAVSTDSTWCPHARAMHASIITLHVRELWCYIIK